MTQWLRQATPVTMSLGPFLNTITFTSMSSLTIAQANVKVALHNQAYTASNHAGVQGQLDQQGCYAIRLDDWDTRQLGQFRLRVHVTGALPITETFMVVPPNVFDSLVSGSDTLAVTTVHISQSAIWEQALDPINASYGFQGNLLGATSYSVTLVSGSLIQDHYLDHICYVYTGSGAGQPPRTVTGYASASGVLSIYPAWTELPNTSSRAVVIPSVLSMTEAGVATAVEAQLEAGNLDSSISSVRSDVTNSFATTDALITSSRTIISGNIATARTDIRGDLFTVSSSISGNLSTVRTNLRSDLYVVSASISGTIGQAQILGQGTAQTEAGTTRAVLTASFTSSDAAAHADYVLLVSGQGTTNALINSDLAIMRTDLSGSRDTIMALVTASISSSDASVRQVITGSRDTVLALVTASVTSSTALIRGDISNISTGSFTSSVTVDLGVVNALVTSSRDAILTTIGNASASISGNVGQAQIAVQSTVTTTGTSIRTDITGSTVAVQSNLAALSASVSNSIEAARSNLSASIMTISFTGLSGSFQALTTLLSGSLSEQITVPSPSSSLLEKIGYLFAHSVNKVVFDSGSNVARLYDSAGTLMGLAQTSDTGGVFTKDRFYDQ